MYAFLLWLKKPSNTLWVTPTIGAVLAVIMALASYWASFWLPADIFPNIEADTIQDLLSIISSSMLAVSTFSLSIMVSAFASASGGATPRATELIMADNGTRTAIASFISAFIYAVIAKIALSMSIYGSSGRFLLFISTLIVLAYVITTLIRWVHTLSGLGRLQNTLDKIRQAAEKGMHEYRQAPDMNATWRAAGLERAQPIYAEQNGYLTNINFKGLQACAEENEFHIHITVRPGELLVKNEPIALLLPKQTTTVSTEKINGFFITQRQRSFDQDPRFGFSVLSEVAQRAMSPAVNDPGTAFAVLMLISELLIEQVPESERKDNFDRISIVALDEEKFITDAIRPIARDSAGNIEVSIWLQRMLATIYQHAPTQALSQAAKDEAAYSLKRNLNAFDFDEDAKAIQEAHQRYFNTSAH